MLHNPDIITSLLFVSIVLLCAITAFFWSQRRFELAIIMILLSPWVHYLFAENIPQIPGTLTGETVVEPTTYIRICIVLFAGTIGAYKFFNMRSSATQKLPVYFIIFGIFLLYALLSTIYSIDRTYTFVRSVEFIAFFGFLLGLFFWLKDESYVNKTIDIYYIIIVLGVLLNFSTLIFFPDRAWWWESPDRFQGIMAHPNSMGGFCMISYPVLLWRFNHCEFSEKIFIISLLCLLFLMHILSGSRTTIAASIFGFALWQLMLNKKIKLIMVSLIVLFCGYFLLQSQIPSFERRESSSITHLTGRLDFWLGSLELTRERPVFGYGYAVEGKIWEDNRFQSSKSTLWMGSAKSSIHNGYLSIAVGLGITGLIIWLVLLIYPLWRILFIPADYYKALVIMLLMQSMLTNFFESVISSSRSFESLVFWIVCILSLRYMQLVQQKSS